MKTKPIMMLLFLTAFEASYESFQRIDLGLGVSICIVNSHIEIQTSRLEQTSL